MKNKMKKTTGLSKVTLATAISKRLESHHRMDTSYYDFQRARDKFRSYRYSEKYGHVNSIDTYEMFPIVPNKLNFFTKHALISAVKSLQESSLSAKDINAMPSEY